MRNRRKYGLCLLILGVAGAGHEASAAEFRCQHGDLTRRVEVISGNAGENLACEVRYWRDASAPGDGEVLWRASQDANFCDAKTRDLLDRLRAGGWTCAASDDQPAPEPSRAAAPSAQSAPLPSAPVEEAAVPEARAPARSAPGATEPAQPAAPTGQLAKPSAGSAPLPGPADDAPVREARLPPKPAAGALDPTEPPAPTGQPAEPPSAAILDQVVEQTLRSVEQMYGGDFRAEDTAFGDLDGDGQEDAAVLVTYEAGHDDYVQYLVAYLFDGETFQSTATKNVGGRFLHALRAEVRGIVDRAIVVDLQALDADAACCETRRAAFALKEGELVEVEDPAAGGPREGANQRDASSPT